MATNARTPLALFLTAGIALTALAASASGQQSNEGRHYRTLDDRFAAPSYSSLEAWQRRASYLREHILASAGLLPMPEKTPLHAEVFGERRHDEYSVAKVYFESLPGFFVTGNLYRPKGAGPFPAILSPHGHWAYGRLENSDVASVPGRAINMARQGFVVLTYDMIGYDDSRQLTHSFGGRRESLWGLSLAGLQLWNSIRGLDFLESLPEVDGARLGATGASGGGTQTFLLAAVDERVKVAAPVNMISLHMQGGCLCENQPGLRRDTNNLELAALIAPRPLLMVSATGDWTNETMQLEYPEMRTLYALFGAEERVLGVQVNAPHNYNRESREAVYAWMARWLQGREDSVQVAERSFAPDRLAELLVFFNRPLPATAVTAEQLTEAWVSAAKAQLTAADPRLLRAALLHALDAKPRDPPARPRRARAVVLASKDRELQRALTRAGFQVREVAFAPFDEAAASKIQHFDTYNLTPAGQRVADIATALSRDAPAVLVAEGDAALAGLLALAVVPVERAVLDVAGFDSSDDQAFVEHLYIPGIRRAGDLRTAASMAKARIVVHGAGPGFELRGARIERRKLTVREIVDSLKR